MFIIGWLQDSVFTFSWLGKYSWALGMSEFAAGNFQNSRADVAQHPRNNASRRAEWEEYPVRKKANLEGRVRNGEILHLFLHLQKCWNFKSDYFFSFPDVFFPTANCLFGLWRVESFQCPHTFLLIIKTVSRGTYFRKQTLGPSLSCCNEPSAPVQYGMKWSRHLC